MKCKVCEAKKLFEEKWMKKNLAYKFVNRNEKELAREWFMKGIKEV